MKKEIVAALVCHVHSLECALNADHVGRNKNTTSIEQKRTEGGAEVLGPSATQRTMAPRLETASAYSRTSFSL